jgi:hypothetical protein
VSHASGKSLISPVCVTDMVMQVLYGKPPYWWIKTAIQVVALKFKYQEPINDTLEIQAHHLDYMRRCWSIEPECRPSVEEALVFIDGMFPHVLDWPLFYNLRELPNQVITTYEHRGTVAGGLGDIWKCSWCKNSEEIEVSVLLYVQSHNSFVSGCGQISQGSSYRQ